MYILEAFDDFWNYTFIAVSLIAIGIGTILTIKKIKKESTISELDERREKRK